VSDYTIPSTFYRVSLKALVFDQEDRLLALQNDDGTWELPGGGWEHSETLEECMRREIREELGVEVALIDSSTIHPCIGHDAERRYPWLKLAMPVQLASHDFSGDAEMHTTRHVTLAEFKSLQMHRSDQCLQDNAELLFRR
jgi:8-oxo-dGTP pyrophosphatase MutT (NUDIX family)